MKEEFYDQADSLAVKYAAELRSSVIDGRFHNVTEQFDAVHDLIYKELEKDAELIQHLEEEIRQLTAKSS